ncbi:hypothetical protein Bhyg_12397, partial [Pseudolycoriella hygida]
MVQTFYSCFTRNQRFLLFQNLSRRKTTNRLIFSNSNVTIVSHCLDLSVNHLNKSDRAFDEIEKVPEATVVARQNEVWIEEQNEVADEGKSPKIKETNPIDDSLEYAQREKRKQKCGKNRNKLRRKNSVESKLFQCSNCNDEFPSSK